MTRQQVEKLLGQPAAWTGDPATPTATWTYGKEKLVIKFNQDRVQLKQVAGGGGKIAARFPHRLAFSNPL